MLQVSNRAAAYLDETRRAAGLPESAGIRLSVHAGTGGQALRAAFARAPDDGDQVIERDGAKVFVSSDLHDVVTSHLLEVENYGQQPRLVLRSPADSVS